MQVGKLLDARWWRFIVQRRATSLPLRQRRGQRIARRSPPGAERTPSAELANRGWIALDSLDPQVVQAMVSHFARHDAFDAYRPDLGTFRAPDHAPAATHVANYADEIVVRAPHALEIANDPRTLAFVAAELGCKPTIAHLSAWWSMPSKTEAEHAELWHRDVDDYRTLKLFCYLTEVDTGAGPHSFVEGSHLDDRLTVAGHRIPDGDVHEQFGADRIKRFTGPAGTMFLENTYGVHRGVPPQDKPRLIFQVVYAQRPLIYGPKAPIAALQVGDAWTNRVYCRSDGGGA